MTDPLSDLLDDLAQQSKSLPGREHWEMDVQADVVLALVAVAKAAKATAEGCSPCEWFHKDKTQQAVAHDLPEALDSLRAIAAKRGAT